MDDDQLDFNPDEALGIAWPTRPPASPVVGPAPATTAAPQPPQAATTPQDGEDQNPYAQFRADPNEDGLGLQERWRLNQQESYYRGTLAGGSRLAMLAHLFQTPDTPGTGPEQKKINDELRNEYQGVVSDLAAYDNLRPWGTTLEGVAAATGSLAGSLLSPESYVGAEAKGATWLLRTARAAMQQGAVQGAVDPLVQWLNNAGGVQQGYDPMRTVSQAGMGAIIGGGLHAGGELVGALGVTKLQRDLAKEDDAFASDLTRAFTAKEETPKAPKEPTAGAPPIPGTEPAPEGAPGAKPPPLATGLPHVDAILHDPDTAAAIAEPKINRTQDVPYTAGPDNDGNGLNIDRHFPESFTIDGKTFDPAEPFAVHEFSERDAINKLTAAGIDEATAYKVAHWDVAEVAEGQWYKDHGIDQAKAEAAYQPYIDQIEHEKLAKGEGDVPPNLFKKPYPHDNVNTAAKESAPVPKPTAEERAKGREILAKTEGAAGEAPSAPGGEPEGGPIDIDNKWTKVGGQLGSNPGGLYEDETGSRWYVKTPKTEDHARNEMLANMLYQLVGAPVPDMELVKSGGAPAVASRMIDDSYVPLGKVTDTQKKANAVSRARRDFAADAWLANHDVVGLNHDNILVSPLGDVQRIDQGGALRYRAQGEPKTNFGPLANEITTMRNPNIAPQAASVFGGITDQQLISSLDKVVSLNETAIRNAVELFGPADAAERKKLADTLVERQDHLRDLQKSLLKKQVPVPPAPTPKAPADTAVTWAKGQPAPTASLPGGPPLKSWKPPTDWAKVEGQDASGAKFEEPLLATGGKQPASGVIITEPDGRVWLMKPKDGYGGYDHTFPKGKLEAGLSPQANAIKEAFEEIGLKVKITGVLGDYLGDTSITRFYRAERTGGHPLDHGPESEAVVLAPASDLLSYLNKERDQQIAKDAFGVSSPKPTKPPAKTASLPDAGTIAKAKALGFDTDRIWYHGTYKKFDAFDLNLAHNGEKAVFLSNNPETAAVFSGSIAGSHVFPLFTRAKKIVEVPGPQHYGSSFKIKIDAAIAQGKDAVHFKEVHDVGPTADQFAALKPNQLRSIWAEFHPEKKESGKLAALKGEPDFDSAYRDMIKEAMERQPAEAQEPEFLAAHAADAADEAASARASAKAEEIQAAIAKRQKGGVLPMEQARTAGGTATPTATAPGAVAPGTAVANVPQAQLGPAKQNAIKSLQQQAMDFAKVIGFPLRQGRIPIKTALGVFAPGTGVVRVREVPDFEVVAHEGGHAIEKKLGPDLTNLTNTFASELAPLVSNPAAYAPSKHVEEGFAEYIRRYIGNPASAKAVAPGFSTAFGNFLDNRAPQIRDALDEAAKAYQAYLRAPSVDVVAAVVRDMHPDPEGWRGVVQDIRDHGLPATIGTMMQHAYTAVLDDKAPVARAVREMVRAIRDADPNHALVDLKAADNPEVLLRQAARSQQAAIRDMMDGTYGYHQTTPSGPGLTDALKKAMGEPTIFGKWDDDKRAAFSSYLVARRAEYLWRRFEAGELPNPPAAFSKGDAATAMAEFEKAHGTFREAGGMVHDFTRAQLQKAHDAGLIEPELAQKLMAQEFYVPFMRDLSDRPLAGEPTPGGGSAQGPGMTSVVKKMQGSARDIIDPIQSIMMQSFMLNRTIQHNDVIRSFVRLADKAKAAGATVGNYVEKIPAHEARKYTFDLGDALERKLRESGMAPDEAKFLVAGVADMAGGDPLMGSFFRMEPAAPRGEPIVFYREGGQLKAARFMSEKEGHAIYETLAAAPKLLTDMWTDLVATTSGMLRSGVITNPTFALSNYIRDQLAVSILRRGYVPILGGMKGIASEFAQGEAARLYSMGGGVAPGAAGAAVERAIEADVNALAKKGYLVNRLTSLKGLSELAAFTEAGTRNSVFADVFKQKKAQGLSDYEAMIEAAFQSTDLLDFSRHGSRTLWVRKFVPFLNAHIQGLDKAYRTIAQPIIDKMRGDQVFASDPQALNNALAALVKAGGVGMGLGAMYAAVMNDSEAYRDASPYLKGTHVVIPVGGQNFGLLPKPFELSIGFTAGEYAYQAWAHDDPRAASQFANAAWQALQPPDILGDIPAIKTYFEQVTGKSTFTGNDIVPDRLQRLPPAQQYTDRTSSLAKELGKVINVSPMKIDNAVGNMFGNWGNDVMKLSQAVDQDAPAHGWEDHVFTRRFIKDPTRTSDVTTRFWGYMRQSSGTYNQDVAGYANLVRLHDDAGASQFLANLPGRERAFVTLKEAADEDGKPAFNADVKRLHPLQRAYDAVTILNGLSRDLVDNNVTTWADKEPLKLNAGSRRDLLDNVRELKQTEMRNAFVIMKEPGYADRQVFDTAPVLAKIAKTSPSVADEIATRYATNKVYTTQAVAEAYPLLEKALLHDGSEADLRGMALDAKADGYEFGGDRVKRPPRRRIEVGPQPTAP